MYGTIDQLAECQTNGAAISKVQANSYRLWIPPGPAGEYRLAQLDDYSNLPRKLFPHSPPTSVTFKARASSGQVPGTWGVGFWNDPFSLKLGFGGGSRRYPALPNTAWFFFASQENYLSLRDDLPANGRLAAVFQAPDIPVIFRLIGTPASALMLIPPLARFLRKIARQFIHQEAVTCDIIPTDWHSFAIQWQSNNLTFIVDDETSLETGCVPTPPLGLVIWIDNQFASFRKSGRMTFGTLENSEEAWIEIADLSLEYGPALI
jgi:hypothetical protein